MARESLSIERRDASGRSPVARRLRKAGRVPGVLYHGDENISFSADALDTAALLRHGATLIDAELDGTSHLTVLKDYQLHPVRGNVEHLDLQAVRMDQTVRTVATLVLVGESPGDKQGGVLTQGTREIHIESTASSIPEKIEVDVSALGLGDTIQLAEVTIPEGVTVLDDPHTMVAAVSVPRGTKQNAAGNIEVVASMEESLDIEAAPDAAPAADAEAGDEG